MTQRWCNCSKRSPRNKASPVFLLYQHVAFILMVQSTCCTSRSSATIPDRKAKGCSLSNFAFLLGKGSSVLGLSTCTLLANLCHVATPSCKGTWEFVYSALQPFTQQKAGEKWVAMDFEWVDLQYLSKHAINFNLKAINLEFGVYIRLFYMNVSSYIYFDI